MWRWYFDSLRQYAVFKGRSPRVAWWSFFLFNLLFLFVLAFAELMLGFTIENGRAGVLLGLFKLVLFIPQLALDVRRVHDTGRSGWWIVGLWIIPMISMLVFAGAYAYANRAGIPDFGDNYFKYFVILPVLYGLWVWIITALIGSQPGENKYGPNPHGIE